MVDLMSDKTSTYRRSGQRQFRALYCNSAGGVEDYKTYKDVPITLNEIEHSFDGSKLYVGNPQSDYPKNKGLPTLTIENIVDRKIFKRDSEILQMSYLEAINFAPPTRFTQLKSKAKTSIQALLDNGYEITKASRIRESGANNIELKLTSKDESTTFVLDVDRGYVVLSRTDRLEPAGTISRRIFNKDIIHNTKPDLWLPKRVEIDHYTGYYLKPVCSTQPLYRETYELDSYVFAKQPDSTFVLDYSNKPGTLVSDSTLPDATDPDGVFYYTVPAKLDDLNKNVT
jgi:hypothetical protein